MPGQSSLGSPPPAEPEVVPPLSRKAGTNWRWLLKLLLGDVQPGIWRRGLSLVVDGLRAGPGELTPLRPDPLTPDEVDQAMRSWHPTHR